MGPYGNDEHNFEARLKEIRQHYAHLDRESDEYILALMNDEDYQKIADEIVAAFNPYQYSDDRANDMFGKPRIGETMEEFKKRTGK